MGTSCTVLEPKELIEDVIKEHKKVLNNYEGTEKVPFGIKDLKNFFKTIF